MQLRGGKKTNRKIIILKIWIKKILERIGRKCNYCNKSTKNRKNANWLAEKDWWYIAPFPLIQLICEKTERLLRFHLFFGVLTCRFLAVRRKKKPAMPRSLRNGVNFFFPRFALSSIHASSSSSSSAPFSPPISSPRAIWWLYRLWFTKTRILRTLRCGIRWDMAWDRVLELRTGRNWILSCNRFASEALFFLASRSFHEGEAFLFVCVLRGVYVCMYVFLP